MKLQQQGQAILKSNKQLKCSIHCIHIFVQVQTSEPTFFNCLIFGKSVFPPKLFYSINYWLLHLFSTYIINMQLKGSLLLNLPEAQPTLPKRQPTTKRTVSDNKIALRRNGVRANVTAPLFQASLHPAWAEAMQRFDRQ